LARFHLKLSHDASGSFTAIYRDHYTTQLPFFQKAARENGKVAVGPGMGWSGQPEGRIQESNLKSNRGKRGETWQPLMRR
jgi:hypothetical protein